MLLRSQWPSCAKVKLKEHGLSAMLKSGEVKSSDLWNRIGVGAVSLTLSTITENYNVAFQLQLTKVNADGPSLKFRAGFSVSELPYQEVSALYLIGMPKNTSKIPYLFSDYSLSHLQLPVSRIRA
jgi:hypothetical protein